MTSSAFRTACVAAVFTLGAGVACGDDDDGAPKGGDAGESSAGTPSSSGGTTAQAGQGGTSEVGGAAGGTAGELEKVTIQFRAMVGEADFACGESYDDQGTTGTTVVPQDLRFFVEKVRLVTADDSEVPLILDERAPFQASGVTLLDFEDGSAACANGNPELNSTITGKVPPGDYVGILFSTAVPLELNHADPTTLPAPLQAGGMTWGWLFGFRFLKAEMVPEDLVGAGGAPGAGGAGSGEGGGSQGGEAAGGANAAEPEPESRGGIFHLGSVECENSAEPDFMAPPTTACAKQFRNEIRLDGFDPDQDVIVADVGELFSGVDLSGDSQCHSFAGTVCAPLFEAVGLDYETGDPTDGQTFFRVEH